MTVAVAHQVSPTSRRALVQAVQEAEKYAAKYPAGFWTKILLAKVYAASGDRKAASESLKAATETVGWNDGVGRWRLGQLSKRIQQ